MELLAAPLGRMKSHYDVVVIGSGYGGGIAASRLARDRRSVCVLERGQERPPGDHPETLRDAMRQVQLRAGRRQIGPLDALFDFRAGEDINVLVGCALGGTSIINANVAMKPDRRIFDERWPAALRRRKDPLLQEGYRAAQEMLGSRRYPSSWQPLKKLEALDASAVGLGIHAKRPKINVTFTAGKNKAGKHQEACTLCGNCVSGCNEGAKNTVLATYLYDAHRHGAEIFTECEVWTVSPRKKGGWTVEFRSRAAGRDRFEAPNQFVTGDVVVLAAGTLGSTEILLRSQRAGLRTSEMLGQNFSANGDVIGFAFDSQTVANGIGRRRRQPAADPAGPCITGVIHVDDPVHVKDELVIEDAVLPGLFASVLPAAFSLAAILVRQNGHGQSRTLVSELTRAVKTVVGGAYRGVMRNSQSYLVMSSDDARGHLALDGDRVAVRWHGAGIRPPYARDNGILERAARGIGGEYIPDPLWMRRKHSLITVHPLGGCVMADDATRGVVDNRGRVYSRTWGKTFYDGLYVADGSIVPSALGVNPLLTISALAERICTLLIQEDRWGRRNAHKRKQRREHGR